MVTSKYLLTLVIKLLILTTYSKFKLVTRINRPKPFFAELTSSCTTVGNNNQTVLGFGNCYQNIYYINLQVGTPSQSMNVQFDTGSNILWLPITGASGFHPLQSSTYTTTSNPGSIIYADGSTVSGFYGSDLVNMTNTSISVFPQILWVNHGISYPPPIQGLIGMGFTTTPNFLDLAYSNNQISSPVFALAIRNFSFQSFIYYDGIPQQIEDKTYYVPVAGNTYWQVRVIGVTIGDMDLTSVSAPFAIIDSGTSYFFFNQNLFNKIVQNFFSSCNNIANPPICPCGQDLYPTFAFMFQGIQVYIESSQYMTNIYNSKCTYLFGTLSTVRSILFGDIFFRNYIITFDKKKKRLGFAGNIGIIKSIQFKGVVIGGYILFGILGIILVVGIIFFCSLQQLELSQSTYVSEITNPLLKSNSSGLTQKLLS